MRFADILARYFDAARSCPMSICWSHARVWPPRLPTTRADRAAMAELVALQDDARAHGLLMPFPPLND